MKRQDVHVRILPLFIFHFLIFQQFRSRNTRAMRGHPDGMPFPAPGGAPVATKGRTAQPRLSDSLMIGGICAIMLSMSSNMALFVVPNPTACLMCRTTSW